ncbi:hypothetical protein EV178_005793 [Coemansia sp. RSA 1646]|nr:hypothetical protein EV178_005793 [Coemansia sp. RSA 1646]KAJ2211240.1 hypothetical protein EV179_005651 [Coemansia sp. RSA 487]
MSSNISALDSQLFLQQCMPWSFMSAMTLPPQSMLYTTPSVAMASPTAGSSGAPNEIAGGNGIASGSGYGGGACSSSEHNNNQRNSGMNNNNGELLLTPPSFVGANSSSSASTILTPSVMHAQEHLSLSDSAAAAAAAAMASAMAMAPMTVATLPTPMAVDTLATPITAPTIQTPVTASTIIEPPLMAPAASKPSLMAHTVSDPSIVPHTVPESLATIPAASSSSSSSLVQQHSELQRSAISISSSKWNAAMSSNSKRSNDATVDSGSKPPMAPLIKLAYLNVDQFYALQQLMREHGEDWEVLGRMMGIRPADLAKNWEGYSVETRVTRQWTRDEMELLATCRQMGICCRTTAKIIGTKLPLQCRRKTLKPPLDLGTRNSRLSLRRGATSPNGSDSEDGGGADDTGPNDANNWETGHGSSFEGSIPNTAVPTRESTLITTLVERQVQGSGTVDWPLVSQQSGYTIQQCLEQSHYDEGKRVWKYTPSAPFDWELAQSMHQFVVQFYPHPTPINFIAVSNFLWITMVDCLCMFDALRGRIHWSPSTIETVRALWAQGWDGALIARQLSPTLSAASLERQWVRVVGRSSSLNHDVNPLIPRTIDDDSVAVVRAIVADHIAAPDPQVSAMLSAARQALPSLEKPTVDQSVLALLSVHPMYDARRTRRTRSSNTQSDISYATAASSLPLPPPPPQQQQQQQQPVDLQQYEREGSSSAIGPLNNISNRMTASSTDHCKRNSGRWTHEETTLLSQYVRMSKATIVDWAPFAESLGTKTAYQCKNKYRSMKRHGTLK